MPRESQYSLIGFDSEESAQTASTRVAQVIDELAQQLGLSLAGLDGVTISVNYDVGLQRLDRGYQASGPLTRTNDEFASGVTMTRCVLRNDRVMSHMVLSASVVPLIDTPMFGVSGKYIIAHELSHAHEHYFRDCKLPKTLLNVKITKPDEAVLFEAADACWGEYAACYFSAPIHPEQARLFEMTVASLLKDAKDNIIEAKRDWRADRDFAKVWQRVGATALPLLKYFSYLLGHAAVLKESLEELSRGVATTAIESMALALDRKARTDVGDNAGHIRAVGEPPSIRAPLTGPTFCTTTSERVYITTSSGKGANGGSQGAVGDRRAAIGGANAAGAGGL